MAERFQRSVVDLDVEDRETRLALRDFFAERVRRDPDPERIIAARVGHQSNWVNNILRQDSWRVITLLELARALRLKLTFNVVPPPGVVPVDPDPEFALTLEVVSKRRFGEYQAAALELQDLGRRVRIGAKKSVASVAAVMGATRTPVANWENGKYADFLLITGQRFFRALGGSLVPMVLDPANGDKVLFPSLVAAARKKARGVVLPDRLRGDVPCADCGTLNNICWSTDSAFWNEVDEKRRDRRDGDGVVCISCFIRRVDDAGFSPLKWRLVPEFHWESRTEQMRRSRNG